MIHITKPGQVVIRNGKHIKATPVTAEEYLQEHLSQTTVDDFLKHFEKHTQQLTISEQMKTHL